MTSSDCEQIVENVTGLRRDTVVSIYFIQSFDGECLVSVVLPSVR